MMALSLASFPTAMGLFLIMPDWWREQQAPAVGNADYYDPEEERKKKMTEPNW